MKIYVASSWRNLLRIVRTMRPVLTAKNLEAVSNAMDQPFGWRILLAAQEHGQHRTQQAAIAEFIAGPSSEIHAATAVQKQIATQVGLLLEFTHVKVVGPAVNLPIDPLQGVARKECAVGREFLAAA